MTHSFFNNCVMGRRKSIPPTVRAQAAILAETGMSQRRIALKLGISVCSVNLAIQKSRTGSFNDSPRIGRPKALTTRDERILKRMVIKKPSMSLPEIKRELHLAGIKASASTLSRRLGQDLGLKSYRPAKKPKLTARMAKARLEFAKRYRHYSVEDWERVMWTDESTFEQFGTRVKHIRRPPKTRHHPGYVVQTMKHPLKQMVWGSMSAKGRAGLFFLPAGMTMNSKTYLNVLKDKLRLHMTVHNATTLMHDGAPCHRAKIVSDWLQSNSVNVLQWPGNSPDCNPIENLWCVMKNHVSAMQPKNAIELQNCIKLVWTTKITEEYCAGLAHSMPRRLDAVIKNKGYWTRY